MSGRRRRRYCLTLVIRIVIIKGSWQTVPDAWAGDRKTPYPQCCLDVCPLRCVIVGDRSFATAGPRLWNSPPADARSALSLTTFRQKLKTHLFRQSYPDIVL